MSEKVLQPCILAGFLMSYIGFWKKVIFLHLSSQLKSLSVRSSKDFSFPAGLQGFCGMLLRPWVLIHPVYTKGSNAAESFFEEWKSCCLS